MENAYKYRIYPNKTQVELLEKSFEASNFIYNYYLLENNRRHESGEQRLSKFDCFNDIVDLKKLPEMEWLKEVDSTVLREAAEDQDLAFQNFFRSVREKTGQFEHPKPKEQGGYRRSFRSSSPDGIKVWPTSIQIPKVGKIKARISRMPEGKILTATVTKEPSGKYFVSVVCKNVEFAPIQLTGKAVGLDFGVEHLIIASDGATYNNNHFRKDSLDKLAKLQRELRGKEKGSRRYEGVRKRIASLNETIANRRRDELQKITTELVKKYDIICIEDLAVRDMLENGKRTGRSKSISDVAWREARIMLEYKTKRYGKTLIVIDRGFPSTQLCSCCGYKNTELKGNTKIRSWVCPECHSEHNRDLNAATNILNEGLRTVQG